ncbi:helix-turn-helix transcriptional regulator [Streptomyces sp. NPDC000983]|uniref:helix-turn-helix domain-containing protein n=1 Tax=Streptomyces sp. NPDC000983 TaxID=3154373 RepID=UPI0033274E59
MTTPSPTPADTDPAAYVAALRRLKEWSGLSYRALERRATRTGHHLPYSTAATMLGRDRLPRAELVIAFVTACGVEADEAEAWLTARSTIACGGPSAGSASMPHRRRLRRPRWALAAAAALAAALLGGASFGGAFTDDIEVDTTRTSLHLPHS